MTLGFAFREAVDAATLAERLPPALARHAAVALALVTDALASEREMAGLRATDTERGRFVSTVAHELRTPLTGLSGYLDLILDGHADDPEIQREFLERGRTIVASMEALVDDLLELSRLESGTLALELGPFSVADALNAVASSLLPIALDRGVRMQVTAPPRLRAAIGDRRRVEQIVTNLAANAIKFASDRPVELVGRFEGSVAVIAVRDEGPGIDARGSRSGSSSGSTGWPTTCGSRAPGSGSRSRASLLLRWVASSTSRACRVSGRASCWSFPGRPGPSRPRRWPRLRPPRSRSRRSTCGRSACCEPEPPPGASARASRMTDVDDEDDRPVGTRDDRAIDTSDAVIPAVPAGETRSQPRSGAELDLSTKTRVFGGLVDKPVDAVTSRPVLSLSALGRTRG